MGVEALPITTTLIGSTGDGKEAPLVLGLQASALVDHVARVDSSLLDQIPGERGGSIPVISLYFCICLFSFASVFLILVLFCFLGFCLFCLVT